MSLISTTPYKIRPFVASDASEIIPQEAQASEGKLFPVVDWESYLAAGHAWTLLRHGMPVGCAGAHLAMPWVAESWAMVGRDIGPGLLPFVRGVRTFLYDLPWEGVARVQTTVRSDFGPGHRMAALLGFTFEGLLRSYGPDGSDYAIYGKV